MERKKMKTDLANLEPRLCTGHCAIHGYFLIRGRGGGVSAAAQRLSGRGLILRFLLRVKLGEEVIEDGLVLWGWGGTRGGRRCLGFLQFPHHERRNVQRTKRRARPPVIALLSLLLLFVFVFVFVLVFAFVFVGERADHPSDGAKEDRGKGERALPSFSIFVLGWRLCLCLCLCLRLRLRLDGGGGHCSSHGWMCDRKGRTRCRSSFPKRPENADELHCTL